MIISNWKIPYGLHRLYKNISALKWCACLTFLVELIIYGCEECLCHISLGGLISWMGIELAHNLSVRATRTPLTLHPSYDPTGLKRSVVIWVGSSRNVCGYMVFRYTKPGNIN